MKTITAKDVSKEDTVRILEILNSVKSVDELVEIITIPDYPEKEKGLAEDILEYRQKNGPFIELDQLDDVPNVGPVRFTQIVVSLRDYTPPSEVAPSTANSTRFTGESMECRPVPVSGNIRSRPDARLQNLHL